MKARSNFTTERVGVNHVRMVVEAAGSFFKEINLQHDVGQDATIVLVVDGQCPASAPAMELGYGSTSAFVYAFRTEMGRSPQAHMRGRAADRGARAPSTADGRSS